WTGAEKRTCRLLRHPGSPPAARHEDGTSRHARIGAVKPPVAAAFGLAAGDCGRPTGGRSAPNWRGPPLPRSIAAEVMVAIGSLLPALAEQVDDAAATDDVRMARAADAGSGTARGAGPCDSRRSTPRSHSYRGGRAPLPGLEAPRDHAHRR